MLKKETFINIKPNSEEENGSKMQALFSLSEKKAMQHANMFMYFQRILKGEIPRLWRKFSKKFV